MPAIWEDFKDSFPILEFFMKMGIYRADQIFVILDYLPNLSYLHNTANQVEETNSNSFPQKPPYACYNCNEPGHTSRFCWKPRIPICKNFQKRGTALAALIELKLLTVHDAEGRVLQPNLALGICQTPTLTDHQLLFPSMTRTLILGK